MIKWEKYFSRVMPEVKGVPAPMAIQAIRDAAIEFCQKTWIWKQDIPYEMEEGFREIFVSVPRGARLVSVIYLLENGRQKHLPENIMIKSQRSPVEAELPAEKDKEYEARVALKPSETSTEGPEFLYNDHAEAIAHGAKARLMYDLRKDWGQPELAGVHHQMFRQAIAQEKIRMQQGYSQKTSRVRPRRFV